MGREVPQVRYADADGTNIAYQVFGEGPATIVAIPPMAQNVELAWEWPTLRRMFERYASVSRYVHFDKRGTGASDRSIPVPEIDQRVDDLRAVMDHAEVDRAFLYGVSEGGPMTLLFAATYPERVAGLILCSTGARLVDLDDDPDPEHSSAAPLLLDFVERYGTSDSVTAEVFAPSLAGDPEFRRWHQRYERQSASRESLRTLLEMNARMDVREVLPAVQAPTLLLHRVDDYVVPIRFAREAAAGLANARLVELPGVDHFSYAGDIDPMLDEIEQMVTGAPPSSSPSRRVAPQQAEVTTLGSFRVVVSGEEVPTSAWGSRRARQLLKRLVLARGWPVPREELVELLWPDEIDVGVDRLLSRLSVQLSTVRRILGGGVVADRTSVRLDTRHVVADLVRFDGLVGDRAIVEAYTGELLPDDRFEAWTDAARTEVRARYLAAAHRLLDAAVERGDDGTVLELAGRLLVVEPFDEAARVALVCAHHRRGSHAAAAKEHEAYCERMEEMGIEPRTFDDVVGATGST